MMMHLKEEKPGYLNVKRISSLVVFILFASNFSAQVNLNGFVNYHRFNTVDNAISILPALIDDDEEPDYLVLTNEKKIYIHLSGSDHKIKTIALRYFLNRLQVVKRSPGKETLFAFVSRKNRVFGTFVINSKGKLHSIKAKKYDDNPDNFVLSKNGKKALLFGRNFRGLKLIDVETDKKEELNFAENSLINTALFYDIDNDLNTDVIYYDIFTETLNVIKNENNFELIEIDFSLKVKNLDQLKRLDYNKDGFEDILFVTNEGIEIFYGDSVTTFKNRDVLIRDNGIYNYAAADFNKDEYYDIAYLKTGGNKSMQLYISFSSPEGLTFPILYEENDYITNLGTTGKSNSEIIYLSKEGFAAVISPLVDFDDASLKLGVNPVSIFSFERNDGSLFNFAVIDSSDNKLKVYLDAANKYYEATLKDIHKNIRAIESKQNEIVFAAYNTGRKLIEIIKLGLDDGNVWARQLYTRQDILNIKLQEKKNSFPSIIAESVLSNDKFLEFFEYKNFRYQKSEPKKTSSIKPEYSNTLYPSAYTTTDSSRIVFEEHGKLFLKTLDIRTHRSSITELDLEYEGPFAVVFVNKKNGFIFMLNEGNNLIEAKKF